eukprot:Rhum_TRINITY_DN12738_c1_g1::Rhum_TRINITY_DN12738_c1_g1_i1::g.53933::m.53933
MGSCQGKESAKPQGGTKPTVYHDPRAAAGAQKRDGHSNQPAPAPSGGAYTPNNDAPGAAAAPLDRTGARADAVYSTQRESGVKDDRPLALPVGMSSTGYDKICGWLTGVVEAKRDSHGWVNHHHSQHPATQNIDLADLQNLRKSWGALCDVQTEGEGGAVEVPPGCTSPPRPDHPTLVKAVKNYDTIKLTFPESEIVWLTLEVVAKGLYASESKLWFMSSVLHSYLGNDPTALASARLLVKGLETNTLDEEDLVTKQRLVGFVRDLYGLTSSDKKGAQRILPYILANHHAVLKESLEHVPIQRAGGGSSSKAAAAAVAATTAAQAGAATPNAGEQQATGLQGPERESVRRPAGVSGAPVGRVPSAHLGSPNVAATSPTHFSSLNFARIGGRGGGSPADSKRGSSVGPIVISPINPPPPCANALYFSAQFPATAKVPFERVRRWEHRVLQPPTPCSAQEVGGNRTWKRCEFREKVGPSLDDIGREIRGLDTAGNVVFAPEPVRLSVEMIVELFTALCKDCLRVQVLEPDGSSAQFEQSLHTMSLKGLAIAPEAATLKLDALNDEQLYLTAPGVGPTLLTTSSGLARDLVCVYNRVLDALRKDSAYQMMGGEFVREYPASNVQANLRLLTKALSMVPNHPSHPDTVILGSLRNEFRENKAYIVTELTRSLDRTASD